MSIAPLPYIDIVFDGPPSHESGRFVEVEDPTGRSINAGEWIDRGDGLWALRIGLPSAEASLASLREQIGVIEKQLRASGTSMLMDSDDHNAREAAREMREVSDRLASLRQQEHT